MTRDQRLAPDARREQLLAFGRAYFGEHGYGDASLDVLAKDAGVSKALLYHYFGGRRGYFLATVEELATRLEATFNPPKGLPFEEKLRASLDAFCCVAETDRGIFRTFLRGGLGADEDVAGVVGRVREHASQALAKELGISRPSRKLRIALAGSVGYVESATLAWLEEGAKDRNAHVRAMQHVVASALVASREA